MASEVDRTRTRHQDGAAPRSLSGFSFVLSICPERSIYSVSSIQSNSRPSGPLARFFLVPASQGVHKVLQDTHNVHLVSTSIVPKYGRVSGIDIGFHIYLSSRTTLATIGRDGDVKVVWHRNAL